MHICKVDEVASDAIQSGPLPSHSTDTIQEERPVSHGAPSQQSRALTTLLGFKIDSEHVWSKGHHAHLGFVWLHLLSHGRQGPTLSLMHWIEGDDVGFYCGTALGTQFKNGTNASNIPLVFFSSSDSASPMVSNCSALVLASAYHHTTA